MANLPTSITQQIRGSIVQNAGFDIEKGVIDNTELVFEALDRPWPDKSNGRSTFRIAMSSINGGKTYYAAVIYLKQREAGEIGVTEVFLRGPEMDTIGGALVGLFNASAEASDEVLGSKMKLVGGVDLKRSGGRTASWVREAD